jgi:hypothetical protein
MARHKRSEKVRESLLEFFDGSKATDTLISKRNEQFEDWSEALYCGSPIVENVPKGVLPHFDLRYYFKYLLKDTMLLDKGVFDINALESYFEKHGAKGLIPSNFFDSRPNGESYLQLVNKVNETLKEEMFFASELHTSGHCGLGKYSSLTADERKMADHYGLIRPNT